MIHPTAVVDSVLPDDAQIGPYAVIGPEVQLGKDVRIGPHAYVTGPVFIGDSVSIGPSAVIGTDPQDLKYDGERTELYIGSRTVIREFANINRGTIESGRTVLGSDCLIMAYVHIAHDCIIGDRVILANAVNMAGHVEIGNDVTVGGVVPIHQFVIILRVLAREVSLHRVHRDRQDLLRRAEIIIPIRIPGRFCRRGMEWKCSHEEH